MELHRRPFAPHALGQCVQYHRAIAMEEDPGRWSGRIETMSRNEPILQATLLHSELSKEIFTRFKPAWHRCKNLLYHVLSVQSLVIQAFAFCDNLKPRHLVFGTEPWRLDSDWYHLRLVLQWVLDPVQQNNMKKTCSRLKESVTDWKIHKLKCQNRIKSFPAEAFT